MEIKNILLLFLIANIGLLQAQYTAIPDNSFEQMLINQGIDSDDVLNGQVLTTDINTITSLNIQGYTGNGVISDLTGIEDFTTLENLNCSDNAITELHLNNNIALKVLDCSYNIMLTDIDITQNINLEYIKCFYLADVWEGISIDFSNNLKLEFLWAKNSSFNSLDLVNNINLKTLKCYNDTYDDFGLENNITTLDLSNNTKLEYLECYNTNTETVLLPNTDTLTYINLQFQNLANIDVSQNHNLEYLDLLFNPNFSAIDITNNPNLAYLDVNKCNLTQIDVSQNIALEQLNVGYKWLNNLLIEPNGHNNIQNIDVTHNLALKGLSVRKINLDNINLTNNTNLLSLNAEDNNLTILNLINNTQLRYLNIDENPIQELDLTNNINLEYLDCKDTMLSTLNLKNTNNEILNNVNAINNPNLTCIEVDNEIDANNNIGFYLNWQKDNIATYSEDCSAVSVKDELLSNIGLYPNPTKNNIYIENSNLLNIKFIKIYNMLGQQVLSKKDNFNQINITTLKPAIYLVSIKTENKTINIKIIKK